MFKITFLQPNTTEANFQKFVYDLFAWWCSDHVINSFDGEKFLQEGANNLTKLQRVEESVHVTHPSLLTKKLRMG